MADSAGWRPKDEGGDSIPTTTCRFSPGGDIISGGFGKDMHLHQSQAALFDEYGL